MFLSSAGVDFIYFGGYATGLIMKKYLFAGFSIAIFAVGLYSSESVAEFSLATGGEKGVYYSMGRDIAAAAEKSGLKINVLASQGSKENIDWLTQNKAQMCIAQSDTVYAASRGLWQFKEKVKNLQIIAPLYTEALQILIRNPLYIKRLEDFRGKRISIGPRGSGTEANAREILEAAGITDSEVKLLNLAFEDTVAAIADNAVDIVFFTSGYPADVVKKLTQSNSAYFFEPDFKILQRLIETYPFFVITSIPPGAYKNQSETITTIGVPALLLSISGLPDQAAYTLAELIFSDASLLAKYKVKVTGAIVNSDFNKLGVPVSAGAKRFYEETGIYRQERYKNVAIKYLFPIVLALFLIAGVCNVKKILFFFKKREIARVIVFIVLIWLAGTAALYYAEHKINESYSGIWLAGWSTLMNWVSFGSKEPFTPTGRIVAIIMVILGAGAIAWLTGTIAAIFVQMKLMGGKRMNGKMRDHYVIINWNSKGCGIVKQLHSSDLDRKLIVIITEAKESPLALQYDNEDVCHFGGGINEDSLKKANVQMAHSVMILANDSAAPDAADAKTILSILAVKKMCTLGGRQVPVIAEILEPQRVALAEYAGVVEDGCVEVVSSTYLAQNLMAQVAETPGLTKIYQDLLTFGADSNEIYSSKIPAKFVGKPVGEFFKWAGELKDGGVDIIPIAISRNNKVYVNPTASQLNVIGPDDVFFAICDSAAILEKACRE